MAANEIFIMQRNSADTAWETKTFNGNNKIIGTNSSGSIELKNVVIPTDTSSFVTSDETSSVDFSNRTLIGTWSTTDLTFPSGGLVKTDYTFDKIIHYNSAGSLVISLDFENATLSNLNGVALDVKNYKLKDVFDVDTVDWSNKQLSGSWESQEMTVDNIFNPPYGSGSSSRPATSSIQTGSMFFDTGIGIPIWFDGVNWIDATGSSV